VKSKAPEAEAYYYTGSRDRLKESSLTHGHTAVKWRLSETAESTLAHHSHSTCIHLSLHSHRPNNRQPGTFELFTSSPSRPTILDLTRRARPLPAQLTDSQPTLTSINQSLLCYRYISLADSTAYIITTSRWQPRPRHHYHRSHHHTNFYHSRPRV